ncbi:MAG: MerR family transcriptional regulator [Gallionellaceae bacterium]|jgi:DNA-binding transcriptional MerR regulator
MAEVTNNIFYIGELSRLSGLSTHTIRFYESVGVIKPAGRAPNGHRRYNRDDVLWLEFVHRLKVTGMPLAEITQYVHLRTEGDKTLHARFTMLKLHRERLVANINELLKNADALDDKIRAYRKMIAKKKVSTRKASK